MIEMHLGDEPIGDGDDDGDDHPPRRSGIDDLWRLAVSAPALAVASIGIGLASLTIVVAAQEFGEAVLFSAHGQNPSNLTELRVSAAIRLGIAIVAALLAVASGLRLHTSTVDEDAADPIWVRAAAGAGLVIAVMSILVSGAELIYVFRIHPGAGFDG
jgi:hypothetical protein